MTSNDAWLCCIYETIEYSQSAVSPVLLCAVLMGAIKEWGLSVLNEHGMTKIEHLYSVTCNIHHIVKPFMGNEDLNTLASQHTKFTAQEDAVKKGSGLLRDCPFVFNEGVLKQLVMNPPKSGMKLARQQTVDTVSLACIVVLPT